jgi:hypothetical protein
MKAEGIPIEPDAPAQPSATTAPANDPAPVPAQADPTPQQAELQTQIAAQQAQLVEAQARIAAMEQEARTQRLSALAKGWHGETATHLSMLELCAASGGEDGPAFKAYVAQQTAVAEQLKASALFQNIGSDQGGEGSAWARMQARAGTLAKEQGITHAQAITQIAESDPALYAAYEDERRV